MERFGRILDQTVTPTKVRVSEHGKDVDLGITISSAARDNSSEILRKGLCMGIITASGLWAQYDDGASDGTEVCRGVLADQVDLRTASSDGITAVNSFGRVIQHGVLDEAECHGVDAAAKVDLAALGMAIIWR